MSAYSNIELVFGFQDNTTKKVTIGPFATNSNALSGLKAKVMAFNANYTASKYQYRTSGELGTDGNDNQPFDSQPYPLIVNKDGYELLSTTPPIVEAYITTINRTDYVLE